MSTFHYTTEEGGEWREIEAVGVELPHYHRRVPPYTVPVCFDLEGGYQKLRVIHSIRFPGGSCWDVLNGWRPSEADTAFASDLESARYGEEPAIVEPQDDDLLADIVRKIVREEIGAARPRPRFYSD